MTALAADRATPRRDGKLLNLPQAASSLIYAGALVCVNSSGYAVKGATSTTLKAAGVALKRSDNSAGTDGALTVPVQRGAWQFGNSASGDQITLADIGSTAYIVDDQTVAKTNGSSTRSAAGKIIDVDAAGVWIEF